MKAIFVETHERHFQRVTFPRKWLPTSSLSCISNLKKNGIDARYSSYSDLQNIDFKPDDYLFLVTSDLHLWQCPPLSLRNCQRITDQFRGRCQIFLIGYHGTRTPDTVFNKICPTGIIIGEPEEAVVDICKSQLTHLSNLYTGKSESITVKPKPVDLSSLPIPDYGTISPDDYCYEIMGWNRFFLFEFSRGCLFNCSFCPQQSMYGPTFRSKSSHQVVSEIEEAMKQHEIDSAYFIDLNFTDDFDSKRDLLNYLKSIKSSFSWCCQTRLDSLTDEKVRTLSESGCKLIHIGIESNDYISRGQKTNLKGVKELNTRIKSIHKTGIKTLSFFMVGKDTSRMISKRDLKTMLTMQRVKTTFSSLHQYTPYDSDNYVQSCLLEKPLQKNRLLSFCILFFQIAFYLRPNRIYSIFSLSSFRNQLRLLFFFIKRTFNATN